MGLRSAVSAQIGLQGWTHASPVRHPVPMEVDTRVDATAGEQCSNYEKPFAEVVVGWNTAVFRPTPVEVSFSVVEPPTLQVSCRRQRPSRQFQRSLGLSA